MNGKVQKENFEWEKGQKENQSEEEVNKEPEDFEMALQHYILLVVYTDSISARAIYMKSL